MKNTGEVQQKWEERSQAFYKSVYFKVANQQKLFESGFQGTLILCVIFSVCAFIALALNEMGLLGLLASVVMFFIGVGIGLNGSSTSIKKILEKGYEPKDMRRRK